MANSRIGQYRLEIVLSGYTSPNREHVAGLWVAPTTTPTAGALPDEIDLQLLGGGSNSLDLVALDYANRVRPLYNTAITIGSFNLWRYISEYSRDFVSSGILTPTASAGGTTQVAQQMTFTFRHANGGIGKHVFLESSFGGDVKANLIPSATGNSVQRYAAWVLSSASPCVGLDNSFPVAPLRIAYGENESVWRKIYRS